MMDASLTNGESYACLGCEEGQAVHLKNWLPPGYTYHFCKYRLCTTQGKSHLDHTSFEASLRIALTEISEVKEWVKKLSESSGVTWRVAVTKPNKGQRVLYKAHYRCQHNVYVRSGTANKRRLSKNTCCEAKMVCTLVKTVDKRGGSSRSNDPHIPTYPTSVRLYNVHNHNIFVAEALRHKDVGVKAIETLTQLFEIGHSPTSALAVLKSDLLVEHDNKYVYASANRAICPDLQFCYRYRKFLTYLQNLYSRRESWALSYRRDLPTRGNQTNNYVEAAMRVLKDKILQRTKAFNLPQLFNLFITRLEMYYEARVTDIALGHWEAFHRSRFLATESNIKASDISQVGEKKFQVRSSTSGHTYTVDMELELCTCPAGHSGAPCKHQAAVVQNYNISSINFLPKTAEMRAELLKLTKASVSPEFLNPLRQNTSTPSTSAPDIPPRQEICPTDHQYHLSAQDDVELHQLDLSFSCSAQLHQTSPTIQDSYSSQPCVQGNLEGAFIPQSPVRRMLGLLSELAENADYSDALTTMAKLLEKMKRNPTQLISAFYCFGKGMSASKRAAALRRAARRPGPIIGCQPTAVARRTTKTGSRRRLTAGRPRKSSSGLEHDYSRHTGKRAQGTSSVNDYTLRFRTLAAASGWNETALLGAYRQGLNPEIRAAMALYDDSIGLETFVQRTTRVSQRLAACQPPLSHPAPTPSVRTIQGKPLGGGRIRHSSPHITLQVGLFHTEQIRFLVLEESTVSIILGRPWLKQHRPILRWDPCDIISWSERCQEDCLSNRPQPLPVPVTVSSTLVESPETEDLPEIPAEYVAFQDVFSKQAATHLPPHRPWDCAIDLLPDAKLPKGKVYPLSLPERQALEAYIEEALKQDFIRPSTSPAASSFFFVGKKDGGLRPCIDYRQLNSQIIQQPYPLPLVPAALEELRGARIFTKLDLRSAYNLIRIRKGDEWKTAFVTPTGHYEYQVMPYGLSISPSVFQTFMNEVFREFLHQFVVVYIDDILIYSRNQAEHRQHVLQVLQKLRQHSLFLKLEKCEFHKPSVQFLGYNISAEGVQMDQGKVDAIQKWPLPTSVKELQRFLGFTNFYRRFIMNYSTITAPLTSLLRG
ncbi:uncharacterized protein LOC127161828 [Labeo rohita]|uniref:uncharacterized protein LOC127161828 n=1 Tax=Labeo rohita TaxID=84645 RepID=UPI0021E1DFFB|nr:uncharacterized protein LOC127161828 [Labeo rohita]